MRTKKAIINFITDTFPQIIIAFLGIFKIKIFLTYLGENSLGLYQLYGQIFSYLMIIELGIMGAVLHSLYKPIEEKNNKKISEIFYASRKVFSILGLIIFFVGFFISFLLPFFIKNNINSFSFLQLTFTLYLITNCINYFNLSEKLIFDVDQRKYIVNIISQFGMIIKSILEIYLVYIGYNLTIILICSLIISLISNILITIVFRNNYKYIKKLKKLDFNFLKQVKHIAVHKISGLIAYNIDILLIAKFLGLEKVVLYTTYSYITNTLQSVIEKISTSILSGIGNLVSVDKKSSYNVFLEINSLVFFIATIFCVPLFFCLKEFIEIWYEGLIHTSYILSLLFVSILFYQIIRQPLNIFVTATGLFKETKICSIIEAAINIIFSTILIFRYGISGCLFATLMSFFISEYLLKPKIIYKKVFEQNSKIYYLKNLKYILILMLNLIITYYIYNIFVITNILIWLLVSLLITFITILITFILFYVTKDILFLNRILLIFKNRKELKNV